MRYFKFLIFVTSGTLFLSVLVIVLTFIISIYVCTPPHKRFAFKKFVWYWLDFIKRFLLNAAGYVDSLAQYLYFRYYFQSRVYFFFYKLVQGPLALFIRIIGDKRWRWLTENTKAVSAAIGTMIAFSYFTPYFWDIPKFFVWSLNKITEIYAIVFSIADSPEIQNKKTNRAGAQDKHYQKEFDPWRQPKKIQKPEITWSKVWFFLVATIKNFYKIYFTTTVAVISLIVVIIAVSVFFWSLFGTWFGFEYTKFNATAFVFKFYCYYRTLTFVKSSLLFVPVSALIFKKRRYWASDEEAILQEEYKKGSLIKPFDAPDTVFAGGVSFHQKVLQQQQLLGEKVPASSRILAFDGLEPLRPTLDHNNDSLYKKLATFSSQQKQLPFALIGSDSFQGVSEKAFVKLMWVNDLVLNKEIVNRLNYLSVFSADSTIVLDAANTCDPLGHFVVYNQAVKGASTYNVSTGFKVSLRNEIISSWADLDYEQYLRQFVLNRVFNKLKFSSINGIALSGQHSESGSGVRSAVYKTYTPELLSRNTTNFLNNPFISSDLYTLYATGVRSQKGRTVSLGNLTDVVLLLKSLRAQYRTLTAFTKVDTNVQFLENNYSIKSLIPGFFKHRRVGQVLTQNALARQFVNFSATAPFSFFPYSHIHHIAYETKPDRFYLLPSSLDLIIRPFLNRLLNRYVKQLSLNSFFCIDLPNLFKPQYEHSDVMLTVGAKAETLVSSIEYLLYKFFSNCATKTSLLSSTNAHLQEEINLSAINNFSVWSTIPKSSNHQNLKNPYKLLNQLSNTRECTRPIDQFVLDSSIKKASSVFDILSTFDELFSTFDFSVFNTRALDTVYAPLQSNLLKLIKYSTIKTKQQGVGSLLGVHNILYEILNSAVLKNFEIYVGSGAKLHLLLVWRTVLKSVRNSLLFFLPKTYLQRSYSYIQTLDSTSKTIGGLSLEKRYTAGLGNLKGAGFFYKFTAVYNRNLLSFSTSQLIDSLQASPFVKEKIPLGCELIRLNPSLAVDKLLTRFVWWWLDNGTVLRVNQSQIGQSVTELPFTLTSNRIFAPFFLERKAGVASFETVNFATLSYDPSGSLGVTTILPAERFLAASKILSTDLLFRDIYSVLDFVSQRFLRTKLQQYAGNDRYFTDKIIKDAQKAEEELVARLSEEEQTARASEYSARVNPADLFNDRKGVFGRPMMTNFGTSRTDSTLELGNDGTGLPYRYWGQSFYNLFLIQFFAAFSYARFGRARLRYRTLGFNPVAPLLFIFKKQRSLLFENRRGIKNKVSSSKFNRFVHSISRSSLRHKRKLRDALHTGFKNTHNVTFKNALLGVFTNIIASEKCDGGASVFANSEDPFGGIESKERRHFRSLGGLLNLLSSKGRINKKLLVFQTPDVLGDKSFASTNTNEFGDSKVELFSSLYPSIARVFNSKTVPVVPQEQGLKSLMKYPIQGFGRFTKRRLPRKAVSYVERATEALSQVACLNKTKAKPVFLTQKLKFQKKVLATRKTRSIKIDKDKRVKVQKFVFKKLSKLATQDLKPKLTSKVLLFLKAAKLSKNYNERLVRRENRLKTIIATGQIPIRHGFSFSTLYTLGGSTVTRRIAKKFRRFKKFTRLKKTQRYKIRHKGITLVPNRLLYSARRVSLKQRLVGADQRFTTTTVGPNKTHLEFLKSKYALFGVSKKDKQSSPITSFFVNKNIRKLDYLQHFVSSDVSNRSVDFISVLNRILTSAARSCINKEQRRLVLAKTMVILKLLHDKVDLNELGSYKDLLLFRSLDVQNSFSYSEHSFEESFFALLGQRSPVLRNPVLIKPVSRSSLFSKNMFENTLPNSLHKIQTNFASTTLASTVFFNYVFLGKGVFSRFPVLNFKESENYIQRYVIKTQKEFLANAQKTLTKILSVVQPAVKRAVFDAKSYINPAVKGFLVDRASGKVNPRTFINKLPFRLAVKLPFFLRWPFKTLNKPLVDTRNQAFNYWIDRYQSITDEKDTTLPVQLKVFGKIPLIETPALRATRALFLQSKLSFLNVASDRFVSVAPETVDSYDLDDPEDNPIFESLKKNTLVGFSKKLLNESEHENLFRTCLYSVFFSFLFGSQQHYNYANKELVGVRAGSKYSLNNLKELKKINTSFGVNLYDFHWKAATITEPENFVNPLSSNLALYRYWQHVFEVSQYNVLYQKQRILKQCKKNLIDFGLQFKFSPLAFDLRAQLPVRSFVRNCRLSPKQSGRFNHKKFATQFSVTERVLGLTRSQSLISNFEELPQFRDSGAISVQFQGKLRKKESVRRELRYTTKPIKIQQAPTTRLKFKQKRKFWFLNSFLNTRQLTNQKRETAYKRKAILHAKVQNFVNEAKLQVIKNVSLQSIFKRSVAASVRFNKLSPDAYFSLLPLFTSNFAPWERVQLYQDSESINNESKQQSSYKNYDSQNFSIKSTVSRQGKKHQWLEFFNQKSVFERPSFRLVFISELITRKLVLTKAQTPAWFFNWVEAEGRILLYKYAAYKKHMYTTIPQAHHSSIPNSSGIEKLGAAFDFTPSTQLLTKLPQCAFYQPIQVLQDVHAKNYQSVQNIQNLNRPISNRRTGLLSNMLNPLSSLATGSELGESSSLVTKAPITTYDLLLSKAVQSFFLTKGVRRELKKTSWHKTEFIRSMQRGWVTMLWSTRTFKRANILSFVNMKSDRSGLLISSFNKQLSITSADGYFYFLLLKEKAHVEELFPNDTTVPESVLNGFDRPFKLLTHHGLTAQHAGFKQMLTPAWIRLLKYQATAAFAGGEKLWQQPFLPEPFIDYLIKSAGQRKITAKAMFYRRYDSYLRMKENPSLPDWKESRRFYDRQLSHILNTFRNKNRRDFRFCKMSAFVHRRQTPWVRKLRFKRLPKSLYFDDGAFFRKRWGFYRSKTGRLKPKQRSRSPFNFQHQYMLFLFLTRFILYKRVLHNLVVGWQPQNLFYKNLQQEIEKERNLVVLRNSLLKTEHLDQPHRYAHVRYKYVLKKDYLLPKSQPENRSPLSAFGALQKSTLVDYERFPHLVLRMRSSRDALLTHKVSRKLVSEMLKQKKNRVGITANRPLMSIEKKIADKKQKGAFRFRVGYNLRVKQMYKTERRCYPVRRVFTQSQPGGILGMPRTRRQLNKRDLFYLNVLNSSDGVALRNAYIARHNKQQKIYPSRTDRGLLNNEPYSTKRWYSSALFRKHNNIRTSRWVRKGQKQLTINVLTREHKQQFEAGLQFFAPVAGLPLDITNNKNYFNKKADTVDSVLCSTRENKKAFRGYTSGFLGAARLSSYKGLVSTVVERAVEPISLHHLQSSLVTGDGLTYLSTHRGKPATRPSALKFLDYTGKFYFERSKFNRSTTTLPSLFSNSHLTVPWERHEHEGYLSLNKRMRLAESKWVGLHDKFDEQADPDCLRHPDYTFGSARDEFAYKENAFSYTTSNLYGLHRPIFDSFALQTVKASPMKHLYTIHENPWWVQRYNFRRNHLNFTKSNALSPYRDIPNRWATLLKASVLGNQDTATNYKNPLVWLNRWVAEKKFPKNKQWKFRPGSGVGEEVPRYRYFFRQSHLSVVPFTGNNRLGGAWDVNPLQKETTLPFNFAYIRGFSGLNTLKNKTLTTSFTAGTTNDLFKSVRSYLNNKHGYGYKSATSVCNPELFTTAGDVRKPEKLHTVFENDFWRKSRLTFLDDFIFSAEVEARKKPLKRGFYRRWCSVCYNDLQGVGLHKLTSSRVAGLLHTNDISRIARTVASLYKYREHNITQLPNTLISATSAPFDHASFVWEFGGVRRLWAQSRFEQYAALARKTTKYVSRSNRKAYLLFFHVDESKNNNYTQTKGFPPYLRSIKLITVLNFGQSLLGMTKYSRLAGSTSQSTAFLETAGSFDFPTVEARRLGWHTSYLWYFVSRSWTTVRAQGFKGFVDFSLYYLEQPDRAVFGSWAPFRSIHNSNIFNSTLVVLSSFLLVFLFVIVFAIVFVGVPLSFMV